MTEPFPRRLRRKSRALALPLAVLSVAAMLHAPAAAQQRFDARGGDYIAAVVNQELVTAGEVQRRVEGALAEARALNPLTPDW